MPAGLWPCCSDRSFWRAARPGQPLLTLKTDGPSANPGSVGSARPCLRFHCQEQMFSFLNARFVPPMQGISHSGADAALLLSDCPDV